MKKYLNIMTFIVFAALSGACQHAYTHIVGFAEGTTYSIIYDKQTNYQSEIDKLLLRFESSLSVYDTNSIISKINNNEYVELDSFFIECYNLSKYVNEQTNGAFDISASPLFDAWGFGKNKYRAVPSQKLIDSIIQFCGMDKVELKNERIVKKDPRLQLNCNAIAKGYSVDIVAQYLESKGIVNYMVEIGGEIRCNGRNADGGAWRIGIDKPEYGNNNAGAVLQRIVLLNNNSIATSGNYRRFFEQNGTKYAHIIDPRTGQCQTHNLLSASVIAERCAIADAYATALMVMGLDSAKRFLQRRAELSALLIFADSSGALQTWQTVADVVFQ